MDVSGYPFPRWPNLVIGGPDPNDASWGRDIERTIDELIKTHVGIIVLEVIKCSKHCITIVPAADRFQTKCEVLGTDADAMPAGTALTTNLANTPVPLLDKNGKKTFGTGKGAKALVYFSRSLFTKDAAAFLPQVILLHELVHAIRMTTGTAKLGFPSQNDFDVFEDLIAIVVENHLRAELQRSGYPTLILRRDHHGYERLMDSVDDFVRRNLNDLIRIRCEMSKVVNALVQLDLEFNPFALLDSQLCSSQEFREREAGIRKLMDAPGIR